MIQKYNCCVFYFVDQTNQWCCNMTQGTRDRFKSLPDIEWLPPYFLTPRTAPGGIHLKKVVFLGYTDMAAAGRFLILN